MLVVYDSRAPTPAPIRSDTHPPVQKLAAGTCTHDPEMPEATNKLISMRRLVAVSESNNSTGVGEIGTKTECEQESR